jgi:hypothetical protein
MFKLLIIAAALLLSATAQAQLWSEDFDSYANGQMLDGTADDGGWKGWDNNPASGAPVTNTMSLSAPNSVQIGGAADLVHGFNVATGAGTFTAWQYIPSSTEPQRGTTYFILLNMYSDGGPYSWSTQLAFNLDTGLLNDEMVAGDEDMPIVFNQWVPIRVEFDLDNNLQSVYYNNALLTSDTWTHGDTYAQLALEAVDLFGGSGADNVCYDNLALTTIPEPSVLLLAGVGLLALLRRKK